MLLFESIISVLLGAVLLAALARRIGAPYPTFLALGGAALSLLPGAPNWGLDPSLVLALFVAPVLLDAAYDTSLRDLKDNWAPVAGLVLVVVGLTTAAVACVAHALVPGMSWPVAIALGAIVAPPDAAAATAVLRQANLPQRLVTILEGESLLNDATALLIYRLAVAAALSGTFSPAQVAPTLLLTVAGSVVVGFLLAWPMVRLIRRVHDIPSSVIVQFVTTFGVWIFAERIGLSGILTIVTYAITVARVGGGTMPARLRVPSFAVWDTAIFMLNVLAFVMIGLQVGPIWTRLSAAARVEYGMVALAVLATVIVVRLAWCMSYNAVVRWRIRRVGFHPPRPMLRPTVQSGLVISWCGMRGIVTLAAAFALPQDFAQRDLILLTAFCVVFGTLVIQGLSLRPLLKSLHFDDDAPVEREFQRARAAAYVAAVATLDGETSPEAEALRHEYRSAARDPCIGGEPDSASETPLAALRRRAIAAARDTNQQLWQSGDIGDAAFSRLQEEFDWAELSIPAA
ncbi:MAG TPA: sodium:proton antiporter [Dokdonella sp.]